MKGDTAVGASDGGGGEFLLSFFRYQPDSFTNNPLLCDIVINKNQIGTFFKLEATRGQTRPHKRPQEIFWTCDMSLINQHIITHN